MRCRIQHGQHTSECRTSRLQHIYVIAADSTRKYRLQYDPVRAKRKIDRLQIYTNIRVVPDQIFPDRPPVAIVPTPYGELWIAGDTLQEFMTLKVGVA